MGIPANACQVKHPRAEVGGVSNLPPQFGLMLVRSILLGMHLCILGCTDDLLIQCLVGSLAFAGYRCCYAHDCGVILLRHRGCGALAQECPYCSFLSVSSRYECGVDFQCMPFLLPAFSTPEPERGCALLIGATPYWLRSSVSDWQWRWQQR
jgi:hypothetical protein